MKHPLTTIVAVTAVITVAGCSSTPNTTGTADPTPVSTATSEPPPLTSEQWASLEPKSNFPPQPSPRNAAAFLARLEAINPELVEDRDPDALVNRGLDECRDLKERPKGQWLTWVNTRFTSPEHPNGFDDGTAGKVLAAVRKYICPTY